MAADDDELLALLGPSLATAPVEPAATDVAFQRRLVLERRAVVGRSPFSKGLRVGVGLGVLALAGVAGVAAASQGVSPAGEAPSPSTVVPVPVTSAPATAPVTTPAPSTSRAVPAPPATATSPPPSTAPATTAGTTPTSIDDHGGRSGSNSGPGSDSSGSGSSGSGSRSSRSGSSDSGSSG